MLMKEYDAELHISNEKKISFEDGFLQGQLLERENTERERLNAEQAQQEAKRAQQEAKQAQQETEQAQLEIQKANLQIQVLMHKVQGKTLEEISELTQVPLEQIQTMLNV